VICSNARNFINFILHTPLINDAKMFYAASDGKPCLEYRIYIKIGKLRNYAAVRGFDLLEDEKERHFFKNYPAIFKLPPAIRPAMQRNLEPD
jgi:hypothetical protein